MTVGLRHWDHHDGNHRSSCHHWRERKHRLTFAGCDPEHAGLNEVSDSFLEHLLESPVVAEPECAESHAESPIPPDQGSDTAVGRHLIMMETPCGG